MTNIEKKSLDRASELLKDFTSYKVYSDLNDIMVKHKIDSEIKKDVLRVYSETMEKEYRKLTEAKSWIDTLINDANNTNK